jgi:hypothetical protein
MALLLVRYCSVEEEHIIVAFKKCNTRMHCNRLFIFLVVKSHNTSIKLPVFVSKQKVR